MISVINFLAVVFKVYYLKLETPTSQQAATTAMEKNKKHVALLSDALDSNGYYCMYE